MSLETATIVQQKKTGKHFILLGAGFGAYQSKKSDWLLGDLAAETEKGQYLMVCVCNEQGDIGWLRSSSVTVVSVGGQSVQALLPPQ